MNMKGWLVIAVLAVISAWAGQQGTVPRASAEKYAAHAENSGAKIGAARLSSGQITKTFSLDKTLARDVTENLIVLEVGLYPAKDGSLDVALDNFALRVSGGDAVKASAPTTAVANIPYYLQLGETSGGGSGGGIMSAPRPQIDSPTGVNRDPITGMPRRGVGIQPPGADIGGCGGDGGQSGQASIPPERKDLAAKMTERSLPQGKAAAPVSGYLYFSVETKKGEKYQLQYTVNGKSVVLPL